MTVNGIIETGFSINSIPATCGEPAASGTYVEQASGIFFKSRQIYTGPPGSKGIIINGLHITPRKGGAGGFGLVAAGNVFQLVILTMDRALSNQDKLAVPADFNNLQAIIHYSRMHDASTYLDLPDLNIRSLVADKYLNIICLDPKITATGAQTVGGAFYEMSVQGTYLGDDSTQPNFKLR